MSAETGNPPPPYGKMSPRHDNTSPRHSNMSPGHGNSSPGRGNSSPGREDTSPRQRNTPPRYLVEVTPGDRIQVRMLALEFLPHSYRTLRLRMGDELRHVERQIGGILVERSNGDRLLIPDDAARFIGVRPVD